ncbi:hypothetical protein K439DRAFT_1373970 [Ramaria rubella]|nr:hypothetical protein K439DRAFT_1373970 [Ramaria rubella]
MYLAGVVNGPTAPALTESNHYMRPLVNHFLIFWTRGFKFNATPAHPEGRVSKGAIIPLIMDLHALRQATGTGLYNAKLFCTFCMLLHQDIDNVDPNSWPPIRTCSEHRRLAEEWLNAPTEKAQIELFDKHNLRWSEFQRLPYWKPSTSMVVDPMHAFQNIFRNLVHITWGIDHKHPSGDGLFVGNRPKNKRKKPITSKEFVQALAALATDEKSILKKIPKLVLYRLCEARELRRADSCHQMIQTLKQYFVSLVTTDMAAARQIPDMLPDDAVDDGSPIAAVCARLLDVTPENQAITKAWLALRRKGDLQALCRERSITFNSKETRNILVDRLIDHQIARCDHLGFRLPSAQVKVGRAVLGVDTITEINSDYSKTVLPSWVPPGPKSFDASTHGQLSAYEWRTTVLVRLVITLPRLWSTRGERHILMLDNFMHLTNAVTIASTRAIIAYPSLENGAFKSTADLYHEEYQAYLQGRVELYPTGKIQPTEHIAFHLGEKIEQYGPIQGTSTNVFERFNGTLQHQPMNMCLGEIEGSFMRGFCMGANLKAIVNDSRTLQVLQELREPFETVFRTEGHGTLLRDVFNLEADRFNSPSPEELDRKPRIPLNADVSRLLIQLLNSEFRDVENFFPYIPSDQRRPGFLPLDPEGWLLSKCQYRGIWYVKARPTDSQMTPGDLFVAHKDSHILVRSDHQSLSKPCIISNIFAHRHMQPGNPKPVVETYLIVREYEELTAEHASFDYWRRYPISGGKLYYNALKTNPQVVNVKNVGGHFAMTPFAAGDVVGIDEACIHILPLVWVKVFVYGSSDSGSLQRTAQCI